MKPGSQSMKTIVENRKKEISAAITDITVLLTETSLGDTLYGTVFDAGFPEVGATVSAKIESLV